MIIDPFDWFSQTSCLLIRKLVPLEWFSQTSCRHLRRWLFQVTDFSRQVSPRGEIKDKFIWFFLSWSAVGLKEERKAWLFFLWSLHIQHEVRTNCLLQFNHHYFLFIATVKLVKTLIFEIFLLWGNCSKSSTMPALDRNVKTTCGNCGISAMKQQLSRHNSRCSGATLYCPKCPDFSTKSKGDIIYHIVKKNTVQQDPKTITRGKNAALSVQVFFLSDTKNNVITQQKLPQVERRRTFKKSCRRRRWQKLGRKVTVVSKFLG